MSFAALLGPILQGLAGSGLGALASSFGTSQKDTTPKFQRQLIDQLLSGLQGEGQFAGLFSPNMDAFQKSVADPLSNIFQNQIAPGIQQKFIASGQQRGTGLDSALSRAGLSTQDQINQLFLPFLQQNQQNSMNAISQLLGFKPQTQSSISPFGGALQGLSDSGALSDLITELTKKKPAASAGSAGSTSDRVGFTG